MGADMTRDRWLIGAIALLVFILVAVGVVLAVGGDDNNDGSASATTTNATEATTPSTTSTTATASVTIGIICTTPEDAAHSFVESWIAGDEAAARRCASDDAVTTLFEHSGSGAQYAFQGCFGDDPASPTCSYTYEGGALNLAVTGSDAAGWTVESLSYVAD